MELPFSVVPPTALAARVQVFIDQPTTITLRVRGRVAEPVEFLIRKKPRQGTLGAIRPTGPNTAEVVYTPGADARPEEDFFTFAAQSVDSPVSASARVDIDLIHRPARLDHPRKLEFGSLPLGDLGLQDLWISNSGGRPFPLELRVNPPWRIAGPVPRSLQPGAEISIPIAFEPLDAGDFSERLTLDADGGPLVLLVGTGARPLSWPARGLEIPSTARESEPLAIPFTNETNTPRTLLFEWPDNVLAPRSIEIPPGGTVQVEIGVRPEAPPTFAYRGSVSFHCGRFSSSFPLFVQPAPARLEMDPGETLDLGEVALGENAAGQFSITNTGGLPAGLRFKTPKELSIRPDPASVLLAPGASASFEVSVCPPSPGDFSHLFEVISGDIPIGRLNVVSRARAAQPVAKLLNIPPAPEAAPPLEPSAPLVQLYLREATPQSLAIEWPVVDDMRDFFIERAVIQPGGTRSWEPWHPVDIHIEGQLATARFRKLPADSFWHIRLRSHNNAGVLNPPPPGFFRVSTLPLEALVPFWIWFPALLALLAGAAGLILKNRVRVVSGEESLDTRIAKLEKK